MPILRLNAGPDGLALHGSPAPALPTLRTAARGAGPIILLIHGFKYDPADPRHCPHTRIFAHAPAPHEHRIQWPHALGFTNGDPDEGLALAFGWRARGTLWEAQAAAQHAGVLLAKAIDTLRTRAPHRPIHAITHSMGSEAIFAALPHLPTHAIQRIVAITGASYGSRAHAAMQTAAGQTAELLNITTRENDLFDAAFERLMTPGAPQDRAMGAGLDLPNALNLQLDCPDTLAALARLGNPIQPPKRRVSHWSGYARPGALQFYARALRQSDDLTLDTLRQALPHRCAPRWSRMFARPRMPIPLPLRAKPAS
ncbi:MAG: hypothetical protein AAGF36_16855 [Pseudomonadota bacterium]